MIINNLSNKDAALIMKYLTRKGYTYSDQLNFLHEIKLGNSFHVKLLRNWIEQDIAKLERRK